MNYLEEIPRASIPEHLYCINCTAINPIITDGVLRMNIDEVELVKGAPLDCLNPRKIIFEQQAYIEHGDSLNIYFYPVDIVSAKYYLRKLKCEENAFKIEKLNGDNVIATFINTNFDLGVYLKKK